MSEPKRYVLIDGEEVALITDPIELADRFVRQVAEKWGGDPDNHFGVFVAQYDRLTAVAEAAQRVSAQWESMNSCYQSTEESVVLADLLDVLANTAPRVGEP